MSSKKKDVNMEDIEQILQSNQSNMINMNTMTKNSREKLDKINRKMDEQQKILIELIYELSNNQKEIDDLDDYNTSDNNAFSKKIDDVQKNMRKIKSSLATIIRKG